MIRRTATGADDDTGGSGRYANAQDPSRTWLTPSSSFVDRVSLELIERESIAPALALDPDLARSGLTVMPEP